MCWIKKILNIIGEARPSFPDEKKDHVQHKVVLSGEYFLVRIMTSHGMKIAADKAGNCLYSPRWPDPKYSHRSRVMNQSRFGYYQVRDGNNDSIATIVLDFDKAHYAYEGNHRYDEQGNFSTLVLPQHEFLIPLWEAYLVSEYPDFNRKKPYGTQPYFGFAPSLSI